MKGIDLFIDTYGKGTPYQALDAETIEQHRADAPAFLTDMWKKTGLVHFADGFWSLVNPDEYQEYLSWFFPEVDQSFLVFMRTAFGGMFYRKLDSSEKVDLFYFCPLVRREVRLGKRFEDIFNSWLTSDFLFAPLMYYHVYNEARKILPSPTIEECYAFVPALAFGGEPLAENVKVQDLKIHLQLLSQM